MSLLQAVTLGVVWALSAAASAGEIVLYEYPDFGGRQIVLRSPMANFDPTGFNDRAASMFVREGFWELCSDAFFRGHCATFGPGEYRHLASSLTHTVSSVREVGDRPPPAALPPPPPPPRVGYVPQARAILYEHTNFGGRSFIIESNVVPNLDRTGFNDRASSLRIEGGYWMFCTDANFEGTCRTFGPGDYASLPWEITHKISSGRRIHDQYPYAGAPNWSQPR